MTVTAALPVTNHVASGGKTFTFNFELSNTDNLAVMQTTISGVTSLLSVDTIALSGSTGGTVKLKDTPVLSSIITIYENSVCNQPYRFANKGPFRGVDLEDSIDHLVRQAQKNLIEVNNSLRYPADQVLDVVPYASESALGVSYGALIVDENGAMAVDTQIAIYTQVAPSISAISASAVIAQSQCLAASTTLSSAQDTLSNITVTCNSASPYFNSDEWNIISSSDTAISAQVGTIHLVNPVNTPTVTLPTSAIVGDRLVVKNATDVAKVITIASSGTQRIDESSSVKLVFPRESGTYHKYSDTQWGEMGYFNGAGWDTNIPMIEMTSSSVLAIKQKYGYPALISYTMQDDVRRISTTALSIDLTGSTDATWYYIYLIPSGKRSLQAVASTVDPSAISATYPLFCYVGAVYWLTATGMKPFVQVAKDEFLWKPTYCGILHRQNFTTYAAGVWSQIKDITGGNVTKNPITDKTAPVTASHFKAFYRVRGGTGCNWYWEGALAQPIYAGVAYTTTAEKTTEAYSALAYSSGEVWIPNYSGNIWVMFMRAGSDVSSTQFLYMYLNGWKDGYIGL